MKTTVPKKTAPSVLFGPQQHVIQFADPFQFHFQAVVICKPALHLCFLLGPNTDLLVPPPGIVDGEDQCRMSLPSGTSPATALMPNRPLQQRPAQDLRRRTDRTGKFVA